MAVGARVAVAVTGRVGQREAVSELVAVAGLVGEGVRVDGGVVARVGQRVAVCVGVWVWVELADTEGPAVRVAVREAVCVEVAV